MTEAAAVPPVSPPPTSFSDLLQQTSFMRMWSARLFGTAGTQMLMVAVGWQMYDLTGSAWDLGLVGLYQFLPALLLTLVAGHVADQYHRARIVACCLLLQMSVGAVLLLSPTKPGCRARCCWACRWYWAWPAPSRCPRSRR